MHYHFELSFSLSNVDKMDEYNIMKKARELNQLLHTVLFVNSSGYIIVTRGLYARLKAPTNIVVKAH